MAKEGKVGGARNAVQFDYDMLYDVCWDSLAGESEEASERQGCLTKARISLV